jgi:hypothetical protein
VPRERDPVPDLECKHLLVRAHLLQEAEPLDDPVPMNDARALPLQARLLSPASSQP